MGQELIPMELLLRFLLRVEPFIGYAPYVPCN